MNTKDLEYYLNLPWQFEFTKHPKGEYSARVIGLFCYSCGSTLEEASWGNTRRFGFLY